MRLPIPFRLLISCAVVAVFALASQAYGHAASRPLSRPGSGPTRPFAAGTTGPGTPVLSATTPDGSGVPGQTVPFSFSLTNIGPNDDSYALSVSSVTTNNGSAPLPAGNVTFNVGSPVRLAPNAPITVVANVTIPTTATPQTIYTITIQAASQNGGGTAQAVITLTVLQPTPTTGPTGTATSTATSTPTGTGTATATGTAGPICTDAYEPDNELAAAKEIQVNVPQLHAICPHGDEDWVYFGGLAGKVYTIDVPAMASGIDLSLGLYDSQGNLLAFNDDFPRNGDATDIKPRIQSFRVTTNGLYYVRVRDSSGTGGTGLTYTLTLNSESYGPTPTQIAELCTDLYEPDGLPEQAHLMGIREIEKNNKLCPAGDADWTKMFMKVGATYRIRTDSHSLPGADPVMVLADRDGTTILEFNDDSNNTLDAQIDFSPPVDGFYYVQVKNVGDIGNQFISYDLYFEQLNVSSGPSPTAVAAGTTTAPTAKATTTGTPGTATTTATQTSTGTSGTPAATITPCGSPTPYPTPNSSPTATLQRCAGGQQAARLHGPKGSPPFVNGPSKQFVDSTMQQLWSRSDQPVASHQATRTWMWGPEGLWGRIELYHESNGGARQVQYFDKARMEITDWRRDRSTPWFVTNGLLVQELVDGRLQIGDHQFVAGMPADIPVAGDADDVTGPTYASFAHVLGRTTDHSGSPVTAMLRRDGSTGSTAARPGTDLVHYVSETGHNIPRVFWDFFSTQGPVDDGTHVDRLVDWVFAMGYPISEPYWTQVRVGGVKRDVLVQAFQRRVLTYTPTNPSGWQVEMGNVGRHYYLWRYHTQP